MFDWLGDLISGIGSVIGDTIEYLGTKIANSIFDSMLQWMYEIIFGAVADFFTMMGNMGADRKHGMQVHMAEHLAETRLPAQQH